MVRSRLIIGSPNSGKSQMILYSVTDLIVRGECCVIVHDPHGQLAFELMLQLESKGRLWRVLYDELGSFLRVLGGVIAPKQSTSESAWERKQHNLSQIMGYADLFWTAGQREDTGKLLDHPMTFTWLVNALSLILYQPQQTSLLMLRFAFMPGTPQFDALLDNCTDHETAYQWVRIRSLFNARSYRELEAQLGGALRLVKTVLDLPEFAARLTGNLNLERAVEERKVIIINGANAIPAARTANTRGWNLELSSMLRQRFARTGKPLPVLVVCDEAPAINAIGPEVEVNFLREARKMGGALWIAGQDLGFMSDEVRQAVKSSTQEHFWGRIMDDELALEAARDIGYATLDKNEVWHHIEKYRPRLRTVKKTSVTKAEHHESETESIQIFNDPERYDEPVRRASNDQVLDVAHTVQTLNPGEFLVRTPEGVSRKPIYFPLVESPYPAEFFPGLAEKKFAKAVAESQAKPEFSTPVAFETSTWDATTTSTATSGTTSPTTFKKKTHRPRNS